jgi:pilus assembly protein CpaC
MSSTSSGPASLPAPIRHPGLALAFAAATLLGLSAVAPAPAALAQTAPVATPGADGGLRVARGEGRTVRPIELGAGSSVYVDLPEDVRDVLVSNPEVADAIVRTPRRVFLLGVAPGQTNIILFNAAGSSIATFEMRVARDVTGVTNAILELMPESRIRISSMGQSIVLTGTARNAAELSQATRIAERFVERPENVVSMVQVRGSEQVLLRVRVVEVQRSVLRQLGVNLANGVVDISGLFGGNSAFSFATGNGGFSLTGGATSTLPASQGGLVGTRFRATEGGDLRSIDGFLQALEQTNLLRTLAEPNLTAISGESARFLAGGEFPVPVAVEDNQITIEFKPFGVGLAFTPVVLSEGRISMRISTEVSELTEVGAFVTGSGLTLPALNVRRAESTVELPSGGSIMMAGLLQERARQQIDSFPGLGDLPVLGAMFRSREFRSEETELVVIATAVLVNPTSADALGTPADGLREPSDLSQIFLGRVNELYRVPGADAGSRRLEGQFGFALDAGPAEAMTAAPAPETRRGGLFGWGRREARDEQAQATTTPARRPDARNF